MIKNDYLDPETPGAFNRRPARCPAIDSDKDVASSLCDSTDHSLMQTISLMVAMRDEITDIRPSSGKQPGGKGRGSNPVYIVIPVDDYAAARPDTAVDFFRPGSTCPQVKIVHQRQKARRKKFQGFGFCGHSPDPHKGGNKWRAADLSGKVG